MSGKVQQKNHCVFVILWFLLIINYCIADETFYRDTLAMDVGYENILSANHPTIYCDITTSNAYLADTSDPIMATFKGDFSVSGPHSLGIFPITGATTQVAVTLNWQIGQLQQVHLQKHGSDQWLLAHMRCSLDNNLYELTGPKQWLDVGGIEVNVQPYDSDVPAADTLILTVFNKHKIYTTVGLSPSFEVDAA